MKSDMCAQRMDHGYGWTITTLIYIHQWMGVLYTDVCENEYNGVHADASYVRVDIMGWRL